MCGCITPVFLRTSGNRTCEVDEIWDEWFFVERHGYLVADMSDIPGCSDLLMTISWGSPKNTSKKNYVEPPGFRGLMVFSDGFFSKNIRNKWFEVILKSLLWFSS